MQGIAEQVLRLVRAERGVAVTEEKREPSTGTMS
jgi:hypothetical protein